MIVGIVLPAGSDPEEYAAMRAWMAKRGARLLLEAERRRMIWPGPSSDFADCGGGRGRAGRVDAAGHT